MAAKKPAKKAAKSAGKAAKKIIKKSSAKAPARKAHAPARKAKAPAPKAKSAKSSRNVKAAKPSKSAVRPKTDAKGKAVKGAKAPVVVSAPSGRPRGGRPARERKDQRPIPPMPAPGLANTGPMTTPPKVTPAPSPKDLAAAHEYLLARSATRSEAPLVVNGKRLPTEEELLKTRDVDYMNAEQLAYFKHRLQQMEGELLQNADETTEHLRESVIVPDPADRPRSRKSTHSNCAPVPRTQADKEGAAGAGPNRKWRVRLLRRNRRSHWDSRCSHDRPPRCRLRRSSVAS